MDSATYARLRWHLRHNHFPPAKETFVRLVAAVLDRVSDPEDPLGLDGIARADVDGQEGTIRDGDNPVTVRELVLDLRLDTFLPEHLQEALHTPVP